MALKVGTLFSELKIETGGAEKSLGEHHRALQQTEQQAGRTEKAVSGGSRSLQDLGRSANQTEGSLSRLGSMMSNVVSTAMGFIVAQGVMRAVGAAMSFVRESFIGMNDLLEQTTIAFTTMLGSAEAADAFLGDLADFAARTPFDFPGLLTAAQRMMAYGFSAQEVLPMLEDIGNASAALGAGSEGVDRMTLALGQMAAKGKVQTQELLQLTELGVPAFQILADAVGVTVGEVQEMVSAGEISSDVFLRIFSEWSRANFGDMMEKQSRTFTGAMSNITDVLQMGIARGLEPFFNAMRDGAIRISEFLETRRFEQWVTTLQQVSQAAVDAILSIPATGRAFYDWVDGIISSGNPLFTFLDSLPGWFKGAVDRIGEMLDIGGYNAVTAFAQGMMDSAQTNVQAAADYIAGLIASVLVGQSPPPEGPLSEIDKAGQNLMETYTEGMVEGAQGAEDAAGRVADALDLVDEQAQLDAGRAGLEAATGNLEAMEAVSGDVEQKIKDLQREISQIDLELLEIDRTTAEINDKYDEQLEPLNEQLRLLERQRDLQAEKLQLEVDLARTQAQAAALAALGDPERRAEIAGEMALNDLQQQRLENEQAIADTRAKLEGGGEELTEAERERLELRERDLELQRKETQARLNGDKELTALEKQRLQLKLDQIDADLRANRAQQNATPEELTEAERERLELQLRELELRGELLAMIDEEAAAQAEADTALIDARQKEKDLIDEIADIQNEIAKIPILEEIEKVEEARRAELEPLELQRDLLVEQKEDLNYLRQHWQFLAGDVGAALEPLREAARLQEQMARDAERQAKELERAAKAGAKRPDNSFEAASARLRGEGEACPPGWVMDAHGRCFNPEEEAWKQGIKDAEAADKAGSSATEGMPTWSDLFGGEKQDVEIPVTVTFTGAGEGRLEYSDILNEEPKPIGERIGAMIADGMIGRIGEYLRENMGKVVGTSVGAGIGAVIGGTVGLAGPGAAIGGLLGGLIGDGVQERLAKQGIDLDAIKGRLTEAFEQDIQPVIERVAGFVQEHLIPAFHEIVEVVQEDILPAIRNFNSLFEEHGGTILTVIAGISTAIIVFKTLSAVVAIVTGAIATVTGVVAGLAATFSAAGGGIAGVVAILGGPVTLAIAAVAAAIGLLVVAWIRNWGDIQGKTKAVWDFVRPILESINERFQRFATLIVPEIADAWGNIRTAITTTAGFIWNNVIKPTFDAISGFLSEHGDTIMKFVEIAWEFISGTIDNFLAVISNVIQLVLNVIQGDWEGAWENVKEILSTVWDQMLLALGTAIDLVWTYITEALPIIIGKLKEWGGAFLGWIASDVLPFIVEKLGAISTALLAWITDTALPWIKERLAGWGSAFLDWIKEKVLGEDGLVAKLGDVARAIMDWIGDKKSGATLLIKGKLSEFASAFVDWIKEKVLGTGEGSLLGKLGDVLQAIIDWATDTENLRKAGDAVKSIGKAIVEGIWEGIKGLGGWFKDKVGGWVTDNVPDFIKDKLQSDSPAKVMIPIGADVVRGMMIGLESQERALNEQVSAMANRMVSGARTGITIPRVSSQMALPSSTVQDAGLSGALSQIASATGERGGVSHYHLYFGDRKLGEIVVDELNQHVAKTY